MDLKYELFIDQQSSFHVEGTVQVRAERQETQGLVQGAWGTVHGQGSLGR